MLPQELREYIEYVQEIQSETEDIEVKAANKGCPKKLYDTLSSFSNKPGGGIIIFGLDENKAFEAVGVYDVDDLQKNVTSQCNNMTPKVRASFTVLNIEPNKNIVSAEIPEVLQEEKPCYYNGSGMRKGSYVRVGDADEPMTDYELYKLTSYRQRKEEDLRVVNEATKEDLDLALINKYLIKVKESRPNFARLSDDIALEKLGILRKSEGEYKPTIAGLLCFGLYPDLVLPQLIVTAVVIPGFKIGDTGDLGERFIDNKKNIGTIPQIIKATVEFITKNMKKRTIIKQDTGERDDKFEYPVDAIREAIINALVHRDYSIYTESSYISIRMFNDRLEITNPGGLYGELTVDDLNEVVNPPVRNKNLIRILEELDEIENRSSGISTMISAMRELRLEPPVFEDKRMDFTVTFKNHNLMTKQDKEWLKQLNLELTEKEAYALLVIRNNKKITNGDYQKINNVNRDKALQEIKGLISKEIIKSQGIGSGTYYVLANDFLKEKQVSFNENKHSNTELIGKNTELISKNTELSNKNTELIDSGNKKYRNISLSENEIKVLNYLYENNKITNEAVRSITGLTKDGAKTLLRKLVSKNIIISKGNTKGTYYILSDYENDKLKGEVLNK